MSDSPFLVRKVAVLGAGVMGAQIAAHLANAGVPVVLFDLAAKDGDSNAIVRNAIDKLKKLEPPPLATKDRWAYIDAANYDQNLGELAECDLVIEAISERMDWKKALYEKVAPHVGPRAIFASNTSGLSINALGEACPPTLRPRFCGIHFFNPPRYMHLVELIAQRATDQGLLDQLETFLVTVLGKGVVRAKDTPNFVANRVGVFSMLATMAHTEAFGLGFDVVDALTGPAIGRAKSATYRTADVVGLDTMAHVIATMDQTLPDDPWHKYYQAPAWLKALIDKGALGQKTKAGVFQKVGKEIQVLDLGTLSYRPSAGEVDPSVAEILALKNPAEKFAQLRASSRPSGAIPVGHFPRSFSLLRLSSRRHRRQRARRRFCDPLGLRLADGPVRNLAGRRLEGSGALDCRRHRRGQDACQRAAAAMGERRSRGERRPRARRRLFGCRKRIQAALDASRLSPSVLSRSDPGREVAGRHDDHGNRRRAPVAHRRRHRHRVVQEQAQHHRRRRARRASGRDCRGREKLARTCHLADARAVFGRGKPGVGIARRCKRGSGIRSKRWSPSFSSPRSGSSTA